LKNVSENSIKRDIECVNDIDPHEATNEIFANDNACILCDQGDLVHLLVQSVGEQKGAEKKESGQSESRN